MSDSVKFRTAWWYVFSWTVVRLWATIWNRFTTRGSKNLPSEGPVLVVSNHASTADPPLVATVFRHRGLSFMAKKELWNNKLLGLMITHLGAFPVDRGGADRKAYTESVKRLRAGEALLVFPEGTRTTDGSVGEFREGAARMALSVPGTRILPVRIRGTFEAWGRGKVVPRPKKIHISVGEPFNPQEIGLPGDKRAMYQALTEEMHRRVTSL